MAVKKKHILLVEDDENIQQLVTYNLIKSGFHVSCADNGKQGLVMVQREQPDLILLDIMLPEMDGNELCRLLRSDKETKDIPIIMLTAKGEEEDIVKGLEVGADDYITKPFSPKILIARTNAILRRHETEVSLSTTPENAIFSIHDLVIDTVRHEVTVGSEPVVLTVTEFNILRYLAANPGRVFSRQQIIDEIRGYDYLITPRSIDVQVYGLRKKLGTAGDYIETIRGIGYRFKEN